MHPREGKKSASKHGREVLSLSEDQLQLVADKVARQLQGQLPATSSAPLVVVQNTVLSTPSSVSQSEPAISTAAGNVAVEPGSEIDSVTSSESIFQSLDVNVSDAVKQKIINGEYVDLGQLLQSRPGPDKSKCLTIEDGLLVVQSKPFTTKITDINQWTDAFLIFASIFICTSREYLWFIQIHAYGSPRCA